MARNPIEIVCMKINEGPRLIHTTARCHVCAAVVAISAATLAMAQRDGAEYSAICRECFVQTDMVGEVMTPSDAQIREILLARRDDERGT